MAVYKYIQVPVPKERVTVEKQKDNKPALVLYVLSAKYDRDKGYTTPKRTIIGHMCPGSKTMMYPTSRYKDIFPQKWAEVSKEKVLPSVKRIGLFTVCQAVNEKTGIKDVLDGIYGDDAAGIMDYAMYSVLCHSDVTQLFQLRMRDELLYSKEPADDLWYAGLFENRMSREKELAFKKRWALQCKEDGVNNVWLCIDGSNDDCRSRGVDLAENGHAKSGLNVPIVSFTYAVTPEGRPVTWETYQGGLVDAKAMRKVIDFLKECGIEVKGVILDRGYCDGTSLRYLVDHGIAYIIMVKGTPEGCQTILRDCAGTIKMKAEYWIHGTHLFGIQKEGQLFKSFEHKDYITLFFDYENGGERVSTLLDNLWAAFQKAEEQLGKGKKPEVEKKYKPMIEIRGERDDRKAVLNTAEIQKRIDEKGLYCIVSSEGKTPLEVHRQYSSRDASETQFRFIKTQLGYGTARVQCTASVRAKFTTGFVAAVIRYEIEQAAKKLGRTANQMILEADRLEMQKINETYTYTHTESARVKDLFVNLGINDVVKFIDESVGYENDRAAGRTVMPRHRKTGPKKGSHHKKYDEEGNLIRKKSGVKPGTKRSETNADGTTRRKPGVATGTKRGKYNKDGSLRKKPGPKPGSHHSEAVSSKS